MGREMVSYIICDECGKKHEYEHDYKAANYRPPVQGYIQLSIDMDSQVSGNTSVSPEFCSKECAKAYAVRYIDETAKTEEDVTGDSKN